MVLRCTQCYSLYDASGLEPGTAVTCQCGDALLVAELEAMEGAVLIENYMRRLATDEGLKLEDLSRGDGWELQRGSARVRLDYAPKEEQLTIESTILSLPADAAKQPRLFRRILELNYRATGEARFALRGDEVVVTFTRSVIGLGYVEFLHAVESVCRTADDYDDELRSAFLESAPEIQTDEEIDLGKL
jgi:T3SS (YopN, CesT) and YbjN peptide-binding chaperone 1